MCRAKVIYIKILFLHRLTHSSPAMALDAHPPDNVSRKKILGARILLTEKIWDVAPTNALRAHIKKIIIMPLELIT